MYIIKLTYLLIVKLLKNISKSNSLKLKNTIIKTIKI